MNEHSVQVVISGHGEQQVRLSWQGAAPGRRLVFQVASLPAPGPAGVDDDSPELEPSPRRAATAMSLELRWSEPPAAPPLPERRSEPAPLATAWAMAKLLRERPAPSPTPRRRSAGSSR